MADWDKRFLELAFHIAGWSKDPSTKVGCVIVGEDREIRSTGFNGFPRGIDDDEAVDILGGCDQAIIELENGKISDEALKLICKCSEGSVRDSLSLLDRALLIENCMNYGANYYKNN